MKKYKYWFFYIKPKYLDEVYIEEPESLLYAYTDNYMYFKKFKKERNMKKFIYEERLIDREEINKLSIYFSREVLLEEEYDTYDGNANLNTIKYKLVITKYEYSNIVSITNQIFMNKLWNCTWINPFIFKDEYIIMLYSLGFGQGYEMINGDNYDITVEKLYKMIKPDMLSVFIYHYKHLLSKDLLK